MKNIISPTQAIDELSEIDEPVAVLVEQTEEAHSQQVRLGAVGPGEQLLEEAFELLHVDAVLLQVRQTGVVALCWVAAAAPVTAGQMLRLDLQNTWKELVGREVTSSASRQDQYMPPTVVCSPRTDLYHVNM